jgi:hypothetical protein
MNSLSIIALVIIVLVVIWLIYYRTKNRRRGYWYDTDPVDTIYPDYSTDSSTSAYPAQYQQTAATESLTGSWDNNDTSSADTNSTELFSGTDESADAAADGDIGLDFSGDTTDTD